MELILALVIAYSVQRARGAIDGVTGPNGLFPALGGGRDTSRASSRGSRSNGHATAGPSRVAAATGAGVTLAGHAAAGWWSRRRDRWRDGWEQGTRRAVERDLLAAARRDFDREHAGPDDSRRPWRRWMDRRDTCPHCGHGGLVPPQFGCGCDACACHATVGPAVTPAPVGGDGPAASTDPTDPQPTDATPAADPSTGTPTTEGEPAMTAPTTDSVAPIVGEAVNIEQTRAVLAQIDQQGQQVKSIVDQLAASLTANDVDPDTLADVAALMDLADALAAKARAAVEGINQRHALMEEAVNATAHVAATQFYKR